MTPPPPPLDEDLARLSALAREGGAVAPVVLRVQADLFAASRRREAEAAAFGELAVRLLPQVDADTAAHVARRVAALPETPPAVLATLYARGGEAARRVAALAPASLSDTDRPEPLVALARARRNDLALDEIARLLARDDPAIDRALAENPAAPLQGRARADLVARARTRASLARALLDRGDLPPDEAASLYVHADEARRASLLLALATAPRPASRPVSRPRPTPEIVAGLIEAADRGDRATFGSRLAAALGLAATPAWRFEDPERHDVLALALLAAGLREEEAIRIFLTLHPAIARSVPVVFRLVSLFRGAPRSVAARLVEALHDVAIGARRAGRHVPALAPDPRERAGARVFSTLLPERREQTTPPSRTASEA
ncbi:hypothetical protein [Salinarimonas sp.]|uniref:hypothetical protein n=1 Tax=Salinarimonas sp. TaxID=2766526 RepID=UPI0032D9A2C6